MPESVDPPVVDGYDYRLDAANVLNHLFPGNEACLLRELGDATLAALQDRPMAPIE
ncbi:uncharacterized protein METZ01_LOCUS394317, partial [marine metagenome]